ncbi:ABC transporter substrate-binding protein [Marinactinospora rubrisoli]|uniref:ABC transporter substrate-binding protein n=1 Tax=Marinactinospora rubrisoli TaxID=2715399 RepID=A0ABW2KBK3_9ACTN
MPAGARRLGAAVAAVALLSGCGAAEGVAGSAENSPAPAVETCTAVPAAEAPAPTAVPDGMGSTAEDGEFPREVAHFGGTSTIEHRPERVVVVATGQLDGVLSLGTVPVGAAGAPGADLVPEYVADAFPEHADALAGIAPVGTRQQLNVERIADLRPDLILANEAGVGGGLYTQLTEIAPTVLTEGTGVNWRQDFLLIADAMGATDRAARVLAGYRSHAAEIAAAVAGAPPSVSMVRFSAGRTRVWGLGSFTGSIANDAGLSRPRPQCRDETSADVSAEDVDQMDADWIFYSVQGDGEDTDADTVLGGALWPRLGAVRARQAVTVDDDPWFLNAGPAAAERVLTDLERVTAD